MKPPGHSMLVGAAAIAVLGLALAPAAARVPSEWVGQWELEPNGPGKCAVSRVHAGGTRILIFGEAGGIRTLIVYNPGWPAPNVSSPDQLVSLRGGERLELPPEGRKVELDAAMAARVLASDAIEVVGPDGSVVERVDLSGIAAAEARLPGCMERAAKQAWTVMQGPPAPPVPPPPPPPPPAGWGEARRAQANLASLFSVDDYPEAAWQAGEEGPVGFLLQIDRTGRVAACSVTSSSGSALLDSTTCRLLAERARFTPARDRMGRPAPDSVSGRIVWRIPEPEPSPPPERLERPARPKIELQTLFSDEDYPSAAVRAEEQGTVAFKLLVGTGGRVAGCMITASSGSESLDSATCPLLAARAVFEPARDGRGMPTPDSVVGRIVWRMPQPEPPPQEPPR